MWITLLCNRKNNENNNTKLVNKATPTKTILFGFCLVFSIRYEKIIFHSRSEESNNEQTATAPNEIVFCATDREPEARKKYAPKKKQIIRARSGNNDSIFYGNHDSLSLSLSKISSKNPSLKQQESQNHK